MFKDLNTETQKYSYCLAIQLAAQIRNLDIDLDKKVIVETMEELLVKGQSPDISQQEFGKWMGVMSEMIEKARDMKENNETIEKQTGDAFRAENAKRPGVQTLQSGLQKEVLREGTGRCPKATETVKVHYEGTLVNGKVFDSSFKRGEPISFALTQVISGWTEGLMHTKLGSKVKLVMPPELGYGSRGAGSDIPPYATLIFTVELLDIK